VLTEKSKICGQKSVYPNAEIAAVSTPQPEITVHRRIDATGLVLYGAAAQDTGEEQE
jgi:hypothetical protein